MLELPKGIEWQSPVITEKFANELLEQNPIKNKQHHAVPWATLIDLKINLPEGDPRKLVATKALKEVPFKKNSFTVCQTYRFMQLIDTFKQAGIDTVFCPHAQGEVDGIKIEPFPLYDPLQINPAKEKTIFYSFIGLHRSDYVSNIRRRIFLDENHSKDSEVIERQRWHFDNAVYAKQIGSVKSHPIQDILEENNKNEYKEILSKSRYSLCPCGVGPSSIRFYESLRAGAIPILLSDKMKLPNIKDLDWNDCIIKLPESDYKDLRKIINNIIPEKERELRENCIKAYELVSGKNFIKCIRDYYEK